MSATLITQKAWNAKLRELRKANELIAALAIEVVEANQRYTDCCELLLAERQRAEKIKRAKGTPT